MTLRSRLHIGYGIMALLLVTVGATAIYFLQSQTRAADRILKDNYASILCAEAMLDALSDMDNLNAWKEFHRLAPPTVQDSLDAAIQVKQILFVENLVKAEANITEPREPEILKNLRMAFEPYQTDMRSRDTSTSFTGRSADVKKWTLELLKENQSAMIARNTRSGEVSKAAEFYMSLVIGLAILLAIGLAWKTPQIIIAPLEALTEKIKAIARGDYAQQLATYQTEEVQTVATAFNAMSAELERYKQTNLAALLSEKKRAEAIVKSMRDGVLVLDNAANVILINRIAAELFGVAEENILGKNVAEIGKYNQLIATLTQSLEDARSRLSQSEKETYLRIYFREKEEYFIKEIVNVIDDDGATVFGYIIVLKNVTGFKELDEAKSGFVATVSHELRTPLSAMNMSLRLLQDERVGKLSDEQKRLVETIKAEVKRLLRIVGELLDLSRAETGANALRLERVKPETIIDAALTPMLLQAEQKKITINAALDEPLPLITGDTNKLAWVLINLISNAVRYTPEGGTIDISVTQTPRDVIFSVKDNGIGIAPQYHEKIFDKFFQTPNQSADTHSGVGLGLALSKEIVSAHGGTIEVASAVGKGSEFKLHLPIPPPA
jgi:PAS domain S-box-containing protein